uniref:Si:ch211-191d15.2 n=1 Tax=Scophthalmus maximus TaxID=52904 RepID=A0A8D3D1K8_SCOMX
FISSAARNEVRLHQGSKVLSKLISLWSSLLHCSCSEVMHWCGCGVLLVLCIGPLSCLTASPCPAGCCCPRPGLLVLCESLGLRSLPRSVPLSTSALSVARNQLCNVDHLLRPFSSLQELSLSQNQLARFPRGLPPSLESLLLQENRITYITAGALRQLGNLTRLDLENNRIRAIQPGALQGLYKLQVLTLKGNNLTSLPLNLPPSLTHLDLSANCISALDLPSLNCLRSMATDLVCTQPVHLAHRLLLNLSVMAICPRVLRPNESMHRPHLNSALGRKLDMVTARQTQLSLFEDKRDLGERISKETTFAPFPKDVPEARLSLEHYTLESLTYEECLFLNKTQPVSPSQLKTVTSLSDEEQKSRDNITGRYPRSNTTSAEGTQSLPSTNRDGPWPTPDPRWFTQYKSAVVISLLAVLCVVVGLLMLAVLLVLKVVLRRQQRVAPLNAGSGG